MTTDGNPPTPAPSLTPATEPTRPKHRLRNLVLIVVAFLMVLGAVAGGTVLFVYDKATEIDRSTPDASAEQFLDAALRSKDAARLQLFLCSGWSTADALRAIEAPTDPRVTANWGDFTATGAGREATLTTIVTFKVEIAGGFQQDSQLWTLHLQDQDGWRVCGLTRTPSLDP